jgi:hypothetical protein
LAFSEKVLSLTIPAIQIDIPPLPESDLDLEALAILGDPIRHAPLAPHFFEAVASRISDLPRAHDDFVKYLKKQAHQSNSK